VYLVRFWYLPTMESVREHSKEAYRAYPPSTLAVPAPEPTS